MRPLSNSWPLQKSATGLNWLVMLMLVASALAWAWHVDVAPSHGELAQVSDTHAHNDGGDLVDRCDHCCHAGAHLVALVSVTLGPVFDAQTNVSDAPEARLTQPQTDPPYIPPIV